jgi:ribosomal protein L19E
MCDYILRVGYKNAKSDDKTVYECDAPELDQKLKELYSRDQVIKVGVFKKEYDKVRTEEWKHITHMTKSIEETKP